jgi:signal transduction protein with GAF and PtsI domain
MTDKEAIDPLLREIKYLLEEEGPIQGTLETILNRILDRFHCAVGTVHLLDPISGVLMLQAQKGVAEIILDRVRVVPIGKGMAGLAAERREPVQVCNLQSDESGVAKPIARETKMEGSIAVPMLVNNKLHGVMGVAKPITYEFSQPEVELLMQIGTLIAEHRNQFK